MVGEAPEVGRQHWGSMIINPVGVETWLGLPLIWYLEFNSVVFRAMHMCSILTCGRMLPHCRDLSGRDAVMHSDLLQGALVCYSSSILWRKLLTMKQQKVRIKSKICPVICLEPLT